MIPLSNGGFKIGDIYVRDKLDAGNPKLTIGIWDGSDSADLDLVELTELRRIITDKIIKIKLTK